MYNPYLRNGGIYVYYLKFFCMEDLSSPVSVFYSIIYLHQHGLMDIYSLGYNPILLYFVAQTVPALVTGVSIS